MEASERSSRWRLVYDTIRQAIADGHYRPGDKLPIEAVLAEQHGVNRHTVRRAMAELQDDGLLRIVQGKGTFVSIAKVPWRLRRPIQFGPYLDGLGRRPSTKLVSSAIGPCSAAAARALGLERGSTTVQISLLRLIDSKPWTLENRELVHPRFAGMSEHVAMSGSMTASMKALGSGDIDRGRVRVSARWPNETEAKVLDMHAHGPMLVVDFVDFALTGEPLAWSTVLAPGERVLLVAD